MDIHSFAVTVQGYSHILKGVVCQDASKTVITNSYAIGVVCDGHGGQAYIRSDIGSELAVMVSTTIIQDILENRPEFMDSFGINAKKTLKQLAAKIIQGWTDSILEHFKNTPLSRIELELLCVSFGQSYSVHNEIEKIKQLYGTTLVLAVITDLFWFALRNGDCDCVSIDLDGKCHMDIPWNENNVGNYTTSLCSSNALEEFNYFYSHKIPICVILSSDGVKESFESEEMFYSFLKNHLMTSLQDNYSHDAMKSLENYLPELSKMGSNDDLSIVVIYNK